MHCEIDHQNPLTANFTSRRHFLKTSLVTGAATLFAGTLCPRCCRSRRHTRGARRPPATAAPSAPPTKVAVTNGDNRTDNIFRALKSLEKEIAQSIGNRRVVIKPNNVSLTSTLAATHSDALVGTLEFLKSIGKLDNAIIAESSIGNTMQGFDNLGYTKLADKYKVKQVDLDKEKYLTVMAIDQSDARPRPVRVSSILANQQDNFIISACMLKTHNFAVATMSIKNIILGSAMKGLPSLNPAGRGGFGGGGVVLVEVTSRPSTAAVPTASTSTWPCSRRCCTRPSRSLTVFKAWKATAPSTGRPLTIAFAWSAPTTSPPTPSVPASWA